MCRREDFRRGDPRHGWGYVRLPALPLHQVKGDTEENRWIGANELARCAEKGIIENQVLRLEEMAHKGNVIFFCHQHYPSDLLSGITRKSNIASTETLIIRGKSRIIRRVTSIHFLDRTDAALHPFIL